MAANKNINGNEVESIVGKYNNAEEILSSVSETMDLLSDAVLSLNKNFEFTLNQSAENLLQKKREELLGKQFWDEFPGAVHSFIYEAFHYARINGTSVEFDEYYHPTGAWFHIRAFPKGAGLLVILQDTTEKHAAMEVIEESYQTLFNKHPDAVCSCDLEGNFLAINSAFKQLFPINEKVFLASHYLTFIPKNKKPQMKSLFEDAKNGKPRSVEIDVSKKSEKPLYLMITVLPIIVQSNIIGVYGIIKDVTEERENREKYLELYQMNQLILESVEDAILGFDEKHNVVMWNPAAEKITGFAKKELSEENLHYIFGESKGHVCNLSTAPSCSVCNVFCEEPIIRKSDVTIHRKDGTPLIIEYVVTQMISKEAVVGKVCTFRDITDKKKSEELLYESEKLSAVGQLAAGIAHEIRNPLTSLKGFLQLIEISGEGKPEYYEIMKSEFARIEQIINELLTMSKPHTESKDICSLRQLLDHTVTLLNTQAVIKNIYIIPKFPEDDLQIYGVENQIKQVFINFIKNAIEAMDRGEIIVQLKQEDDYAVVAVIDEGCGIPESIISKVGEPFFTTKEKGTGLGFMISHQIIDEHGGDIQVDSKEGEGTTITVEIPIHTV